MTTHLPDPDTSERLRRWRLILGGGEADGIQTWLAPADLEIDRLLAALYDADRSGDLAASSPGLARWLGDIRRYFPSPVVQIMQRDALDRLDLCQMLLEPELLGSVEADVHLVVTLLSLKSLLPERTKETARIVVQKVVDELLARLENPLRQAVQGSLNRSKRNRRPRFSEIDWPRSIRANLKHYQPDYHTIIPETRLGFGRKRGGLQQVILCLDQSASMAASIVYASVFAAALAKLPAVKTQLVAFDTSVVDLTDELDDPVELLFGVQLGGGTHIARALSYCQGLVQQPQETILILISDLFEGGRREELMQRAASLEASGVKMIALLALNDDGAPGYSHEIAAAFAGLGIPAFACTPDKFPALMATAIRNRDFGEWANE